MKQIILIGFMGSGKSTIGARLAEELNLDLKELDALIEKKQNLPITEIFDTRGEAFFRELEHNVLVESLLCDAVIATGGGIIIHNENFSLLKHTNNVIYLRGTIETLYERIKRDQINQRPLADSASFELLNERLISRRKRYEQAADLIIEIDNKSIEEITNEILKYLGEVIE